MKMKQRTMGAHGTCQVCGILIQKGHRAICFYDFGNKKIPNLHMHLSCSWDLGSDLMELVTETRYGGRD